MSKRFKLKKGEICEWGQPISNERILKLLSEAEYMREDLRIIKSSNENLRGSLHYFQGEYVRLKNGIKDCVGGHDDLKKFAKKKGLI